MNTACLNDEQWELMFTVMAEETNVKILIVTEESLQMISTELFASAISNVEEVTLIDEVANIQQMAALFSVITVDERSLKKLNISTCLICNKDPDTVGAALNRLEEVTVTACCNGASGVILNAIFRNLVDGESKLKRLKFKSCLDPGLVGQLDQEVVSRVREKIGEFYDKFWEYSDSEEDSPEVMEDLDREEETSGRLGWY